ncbi:MAG: PEP-CTERM sorting domain-containing protein [Opitutales bacterium]|nr:PEP-CTERM sorting domain-containing protein [Opitutales bacterium]
MNAVSPDSHSATNFLGILLGNGLDEVGALYIGESGVYWGGTAAANLLYGQSNDAYKDKFFTQSTNSFRVDWIGETETGAASGFYVWLNDQLIGEALSGLVRSDVVSSYKNSLLVGDIGSAYVTFAEISEMSFDAQKAYAPSVPEPSAFGLLAGMGAIALVVSRRRRR